jgi:hypothetical protein
MHSEAEPRLRPHWETTWTCCEPQKAALSTNERWAIRSCSASSSSPIAWTGCGIMVYPRLVSTDVDNVWLLATCGEAGRRGPASVGVGLTWWAYGGLTSRPLPVVMNALVMNALMMLTPTP